MAKTKAAAKDSLESLGFEAALEQLEGLVERLEEGDLPLESALEAFESGVALTRRCADQLAQAERRVATLSREGAQLVEHELDPDGAPAEDD